MQPNNFFRKLNFFYQRVAILKVIQNLHTGFVGLKKPIFICYRVFLTHRLSVTIATYNNGRLGAPSIHVFVYIYWGSRLAAFHALYYVPFEDISASAILSSLKVYFSYLIYK